jgi:hypothetical protein
VDRDLIEMRRELGELEVEIANLSSSTGCLVHSLHDRAKRIFLKPTTLEVKISAKYRNENQDSETSRRPSDCPPPLHDIP